MKTLKIIRILIPGLVLSIFLVGTQPAATATGMQTLNSGWLLETAKNTLLTSDPWLSSGCSVEITGAPADFIIYREGRIDVSGRLERTPNGLRDTGSVIVDVFVGGELYMRFDPSPYMSVSLMAYTTTRDIDRGEVLNESDVELTSVNVTTIGNGDVMLDLDEITGLAARTNISSGRIIVDDLLEMPIVIERGDDVIVYVPLGGAAIRMRGIAIDAGAVGDEIRVRNPDSNVIITATVTGPGYAEVSI